MRELASPLGHTGLRGFKWIALRIPEEQYASWTALTDINAGLLIQIADTSRGPHDF